MYRCKNFRWRRWNRLEVLKIQPEKQNPDAKIHAGEFFESTSTNKPHQLREVVQVTISRSASQRDNLEP